ncbi:hypothetical protein LJC19_05785 [Oxalobacter sp. OttesenSCG-928-P03]|nr:hypothetical protein [Oxalobacter sp. OttesenSCG-928-P03]
MTTGNSTPGRKDTWRQETMTELGRIMDGADLTFTGWTSVTPVRYVHEYEVVEECDEADAEMFGVYVQVTGEHRGVAYFEWYWLMDFESRQEADEYAGFVRELLPLYEGGCK